MLKRLIILMLNMKKNSLIKRIMGLMLKKYLIKIKVIFRSIWLRSKTNAKIMVLVKKINNIRSNDNLKFSNEI